MTLLRLLPRGVELSAHPNESILEVIRRNGFTYWYGCRRGGCGICKADLVSGEVRYHKAVAYSVLSEQERAANVVLTCRACPASDEVVLQLRHAERLKLNVPIAFAIGQREVAAEKAHKTASA
ncbi:2Fe-2S iron-sulfur cluster binding domain-containing protein [Mycobacterium sp. SM1]|uniref:2Fe-2S iron-sulfur cluster-binding protein n=1 Tax=Mycobacterium sp. SM1 TaxID=2816243 RepID=UPI001BCBB1BF|nr:2Fe-2S iron-sulfur cluster-binding protein [Mycobacterium sp. SM1]MBS4730321.1 2Fe-2S iron-sulfur cluster binding domain-containing protein [Mycobacterium sp. SM1]